MGLGISTAKLFLRGAHGYANVIHVYSASEYKYLGDETLQPLIDLLKMCFNIININSCVILMLHFLWEYSYSYIIIIKRNRM